MEKTHDVSSVSDNCPFAADDNTMMSGPEIPNSQATIPFEIFTNEQSLKKIFII